MSHSHHKNVVSRTTACSCVPFDLSFSIHTKATTQKHAAILRRGTNGPRTARRIVELFGSVRHQERPAIVRPLIDGQIALGILEVLVRRSIARASMASTAGHDEQRCSQSANDPERHQKPNGLKTERPNPNDPANEDVQCCETVKICLRM